MKSAEETAFRDHDYTPSVGDLYLVSETTPDREIMSD
jgi:hypothetical protein